MILCHILPVGRLFYVFSNNQPAYWGLHLPWYCFHGGTVLVKSLSMLIAHCPESFREEI